MILSLQKSVVWIGFFINYFKGGYCEGNTRVV